MKKLIAFFYALLFYFFLGFSEDKVDKILFHPFFKKDISFNCYLKDIETIYKESYDSPIGLFILSYLNHIIPLVSSPSELGNYYNFLCEGLLSDYKNSPFAKIYLYVNLLNISKRFFPKEYESYLLSSPFIRKWRVLGPIGENKEYFYLKNKIIKLGFNNYSSVSYKGRCIAWKELISPDILIKLAPYKNRVYILTTTLISSTNQEVKFFLKCEDSLCIWVGNKKITIDMNRYSRKWFYFSVNLKEGDNPIIIKTMGEFLIGYICRSKIKIEPSKYFCLSKLEYKDCFPKRVIDFSSIKDKLLRGYLHGIEEDIDNATYILESLSLDSFKKKLMLLEMYKKSTFLPFSIKTIRIKKLINALYKEEPNDYRSIINKLVLLEREQKYSEGMKLLGKSLKLFPSRIFLWKFLIDFESSHKFSYRVLKLLNSLKKYKKDLIYLYLVWKYYREEKVISQCLPLIEKLAKSDVHYLNLLESVVDKWISLRKFKEVRDIGDSYLLIKPSFSLKILKRYFEKTNDVSILKKLQTLLSWYPFNSSIYSLVGDMYLQLGKRSDAIYYYGRSLLYNPTNVKLRNKIRFLTNSFFLKDALKYDIKKEESLSLPYTDNRAIYRTLVDYCYISIEPDKGGYYLFAHTVEKVLQKYGRKEVGMKPKYSHIIVAHTITQDGKEIEPLNIKREGTITFPKVNIGDMVEYSYWRYSFDNDWLPDFFFQDIKDMSDIGISRFVVSIPISLFNSYTILSNKISSYKRKTINNRILLLFEKRGLPRPIFEPYMPPLIDILPVVRVEKRETLEDFKQIALARFYRKIFVPLSFKKEIYRLFSDYLKDKDRLIRKVYTYVHENVHKEDFSKPAYSTFLTGKGSREALFVAIMRNLGIESYFGFGVPYNIYISKLNKRSRFSRLFIYPLVWIKTHKHYIWLDLTRRYMPFGTISSNLEGMPVYRIDPKDYTFHKEILPYNSSEVYENKEKYIFYLNEDKKGTLHFKLSYSLYSSAFYRERLKDFTDRDKELFIEEVLSNLYTGLKLENFNISNLQDSTQNIIIEGKAKITYPFNKKMSLPLPRLNLTEKYIRTDKRRYNMFLGTGRSKIATRIVIHVKKSPILKEIDFKRMLREILLFYKLKVYTQGNEIVIEREYWKPSGVLQKEDYKRFSEYCKEIDNIEASFIELQ